MATPFDIIVSGHLCLDLIPGLNSGPLEAILQAGALIEANPLEISTGGAVSNSGLALHHLGIRVGLMATVGDDLQGQWIVEFLRSRAHSLGALISKQKGMPSSYSIVINPPGCDRLFLHHSGTNATFGAEHIDYQEVAKAKIFHLGYPPLMPRLIADEGRELHEIYAHVKSMGVVTSMDMALPDPNGYSGRANWLRILQKLLPQVDIFLPSIEEALFMLRRSDYELWRGEILQYVTRNYLHKMADELLAMGGTIVGFKLGKMGFYLRAAPESSLVKLSRLAIDATAWSNIEIWRAAYVVQVVGTTGAGDAAYAGFLAAILQGFAPEVCLQWANAVGACNVEAMDASSAVSSWQNIAKRLRNGWATQKVSLSGYSSKDENLQKYEVSCGL